MPAASGFAQERQSVRTTRHGQGGTVRTARDLLSPDLLNGLEGIEQGLRRRQSLGRIGVIGLLGLATVQIGLGVSSLTTSVSWSAVMSQWWVFLASTVFAAILVLLVATKYWIKESRTAFRYTCRIVKFDAVAPTPDDALPWLRHDLAELLNDRVGRLSFLDDEPAQPEQQEAHVHIAGEYLIRKEVQNGSDVRVLEVTPRLRVGGPAASATLAHTVRYELPPETKRKGSEEVVPREHYDKILEQVYFSVATRLYKQIQRDVEQKIALLPTRYLRATAYLYEAEDYAQSNTLDAYDDAQELFEKARLLYDPSARQLPRARLRRYAFQAWRPLRWLVGMFRRALSHLVLRFGRREAMLARTELGLANTLVARRALARLSGRRVNQIFVARAIAERSRDRLSRLARLGYRGAAETLFDSRVSLALVLHYLGSDERAEDELKCARAALPDRAEENPRYLFAAALVEPRTTTALSLLRRAVELSPRYEVAQFERARRTEMLWQFRPDLEKALAQSVIDEYLSVVRVNPGNIQAWSSLGHTRWLIAEDGDDAALKRAQEDFERGLEYKEIKRDTFVAGLRYSLARIAAERSRFAEAYGHYVASTTASVGEGIAHGSWAEQHNSVVRNPVMLARFQRYAETVERERQKAQAAHDVETPILRSVQAFVDNDYGEACTNFFERTGKERYRKLAFEQYEKARDERKGNPRYVVPAYNLCLLNRLAGNLEAAQKNIRTVRRQEPKWPEALLEEMMVEAWLSREPAERWKSLGGEIAAEEADLKSLEKRLEAIRAGRTGDLDDEGPTRIPGSGLGADATEIVAAGSPLLDLETRVGEAREKLEELQQEREQVTKILGEAAEKAVRTVHGLVPHEWLWKGSDDDGWVFRWSMVPTARASGRRRKSDDRWEQDFGDLHARALEAWAHTRALSRADEMEGRKLQRPPRRTEQLLRHLEARFWPDRQEGLAARLLLETEPSLVDRLGRLAVRSLAFDPANYRLLHDADEHLSGDGRDASKKRDAFVQAIGQRDVAPPLLVWLGEKLDELEAYDCALDAYGGAGKGRQDDVDKTTLLVGRARAQWGVCRYDEAMASLALVPRTNGPGEWRLKFVTTLNQRRQLGNGGQAVRGGAPVTEPRTTGRRLGTLTGITALRRSKNGRSEGGENGSSPVLEAEANETDGCRALADWLQAEHGACVAAGDVAGASDAAQALLALSAARRKDTAPNRTTPLPDVSASTGDAELDRESSVVPLLRRLALEAHPSVIFDHEDRFWNLVRQQIPEVQKTIREETGIPLPLPSYLRNDYLPEGAFRVLANEVPVEHGAIEDDGSYEPIVVAVTAAMKKHLRKLVGVDEMVAELKALPKEYENRVKDLLNDDVATIKRLMAVRERIDENLRVDFEALLHDQPYAGADTVDDRSKRPVEAGRQGPSWAAHR